MSNRAKLYLASILTLELVVIVIALLQLPAISALDWPIAGLLILLAIGSHLYEARDDHHSYYPNLVFYIIGLHLLPFPIFILQVLAAHSAEWIKDRMAKEKKYRPKWYFQPFNSAIYILPGLLVKPLYDLLVTYTTAFSGISPVFAGFIAACCFVVINHILLGYILILARGETWKKTGLLSVQTLLPEIIMACLGYLIVGFWNFNPWYMLLALLPLVLMYQALKVPQLKKSAQLDAKTGLWNARHFTSMFEAEMKRTKRFNRPLALIMADLDLLRNINNTYGHLAGDTVLAGIARLIQQSLREYDMAGRFGGEEFILALPETDRASAYALAERLRKAIEKERFTVSTSPTPIGVTMSMGIACYPDDAIDMKTLVHEADVAVYHAKLSGRNCVVNVTEVPRSIRLESRVTGDRFAAPSVPTFNPRPEQVAPAMPEASTAPAQPSAPDSAPLPSVDHPPRMGPVLSIHYPQYALPAFVGGVSVLGIVTMLISLLLLPLPTTGMLQTIAVLTVLAVGVELLQIKNYFDNTISVSVSILFAAAIITGIPGLAIVSAAIALIHHLQKRPRIYKTVFNWANHLIAGSAAALVISVIGLPLQINHLPVLAVPLIGTAFMYFGLETGLLSTAIGLSTHTNPIQIWREQFKWLTSHYLVLCILGAVTGVAHTIIDIPGILVFMLPILMMHFNQKEYLNHTEHSMQELKRLNYELSYANKEVLTAKQTIEHINEGLFVAFAKIIDARDPFVSGHADKVADYSAAIARELGLPPDRVEIIRQAGFMHDIGKIAIAEHVLHKPSKLTDEEYEYIKTHAALGGEFLETCHGLRHLAPFVRHHHEWWNGHGYPDGLCGEQIPLESRILAVCDSVEAMASDRPYHKGWPVAQVIEEVRRCAGTQFDPTVAEAFIHLAEQHGEAFIINSADKVREKYGDNIFIKNNIIPFPAPSPEQGYSTLVPSVEK